MGFVPPTFEEWSDIKKLTEWAKRRQQEKKLFGIVTVVLCSICATVVIYALITKC